MSLSSLLTDENRSVKITVDGIDVEGRLLHYTKKDFVIEITAPYRNLSSGSHLMYAVPVTYDSEYGERAIKSVLQALYFGAKFISENIEDLMVKFEEFEMYLNEVRKQFMTEEHFWEKRRELRKAFKSGELIQKDYQRALMSLEREMYDGQRECSELRSEFYRSTFPSGACHGSYEEIVNILKGKTNLF